MEDVMVAALAERVSPDVSQFEANAALWRLEVERHVYRLIEDRAVGHELGRGELAELADGILKQAELYG